MRKIVKDLVPPDVIGLMVSAAVRLLTSPNPAFIKARPIIVLSNPK